MEDSTARGRPRSLHGLMVEALGVMIATAPSDCGPLDLVKIAGEYEVSRNVLRESLRTLEAKGLIAAKPNAGTRVRPVSDWNLLDPQVISWRSAGPARAQQARELAQISAALEPLIARLAAEQAAAMHAPRRDRLADLAATLTDAAQAGDGERFARADLEFHMLLAGTGANAALGYLAGVLYGQLVAEGVGLCPPDADCAAAHAALAREVLDGEAPYAASIALTAITPRRAGTDGVCAGPGQAPDPFPRRHRRRLGRTAPDTGGES